MYNFQSCLSVFPVEYKRQLCYSILETYHSLCDGQGAWTKDEATQIEGLYRDIQAHALFMAELRGETNTRFDPILLI